MILIGFVSYMKKKKNEISNHHHHILICLNNKKAYFHWPEKDLFIICFCFCFCFICLFDEREKCQKVFTYPKIQKTKNKKHNIKWKNMKNHFHQVFFEFITYVHLYIKFNSKILFGKIL